MFRVLHRKLHQKADSTLPVRNLAVEHGFARIGVLACFPPGWGLRYARVRTVQDRPRGGVMNRRKRKAGVRTGLQGRVRGSGKLAGGQGLSGPLPSVEVRSSVRVPKSGNRPRQAGTAGSVLQDGIAFGRPCRAGRFGGKGTVTMVAVVRVARFVRGMCCR